MKTPKSCSKNGSVLVVVLGVCAVLVMVGAVMTSMVSAKAFQARRLRDGSQALAIAEAGVGDMIGKLTSDYGTWDDNTISSNFAEGSYVTVSETLANSNILITSVGTVNGRTRTTVLEIMGNPDELKDSLIDGIGIFGGGPMTLTGNDIYVGSVHCNDDVYFDKGTINGDLTSAGTITVNGGTVTGQVEEGVDPIPLDNPFDFEAYRISATNNGLYYGTSTNFSIDLMPSNGIIYVNGNVTCSTGIKIYGCLVANGNITMLNQIWQTNAIYPTNAVANLPALLATGNITENNRNTYYGTMYCAGNFSSDNNRTVYGCVIAGGIVDIKNRFHLELPPEPPLWDPDTNTTPVVTVGAWLK